METTIMAPSGRITIRPATPTDVAAYRDLRLEALRNHPEAFSADYEKNLAQPMSYWEDRLSYAAHTVKMFFATHDQKLIGMCGIARENSPKTRHSAMLVSVYIQPTWRGHHIAEELINTSVAWAQTQDVRIVKLGVGTTNTSAIRCYVRCGFQVYGIEPQALYCDEVFYDELLMARML